MDLDKDIEKSIKHIEERIKYSDLRPEIVCNKKDIENVLSELERYKQYYEEQNEVNKVFVPRATFDMVNAELETWKKIAELFGKSLINISGEKTSLEELIDWAKREVENGKSN